MSRTFQALAAFALAGAFSISVGWTQTHAKTGFQPAELSSAAGIEYPVNTVAMGAVVFELTIDESGAVQNVQPVREVPSLTEPAMRAVKSWHFKPAKMDGDPVQSRATVVVMFNPPQNPPVNPLPALSSTAVSARPQVQPAPPEIVSAIFATYPMTSAVKKGTVVAAHCHWGIRRSGRCETAARPAAAYRSGNRSGEEMAIPSGGDERTARDFERDCRICFCISADP